jgi:hypothetical protein
LRNAAFELPDMMLVLVAAKNAKKKANSQAHDGCWIRSKMAKTQAKSSRP